MAKKKVDVTVTKTIVKHHTTHHHKTRPKHAHAKRGPSRSMTVSRGSLEEQTISSLVELQKVHINLAEKFNKLSNQIENLLGLFELAARNFAKQPSMQNTEKDKEFLDKIDKLLDQNKLLAKGLSMMEEKMRERVYGVSSQNSSMQRPTSFNQSQMQQSIASTNLDEI
jgi:conjugal transfer/entry exclusion protein